MQILQSSKVGGEDNHLDKEETTCERCKVKYVET